MKLSRLLIASAVVVALGAWAYAFACPNKSGASASAASSKGGACSAQMAAQCTPEMAAACKAKGASAASANCAHSGNAAVTADMKGGDACCPGGMKATAAKAGKGSCDAHGTKATTAGMDGCAQGAKATSAVAAGSSGAHGTSAMVAGAGCGQHQHDMAKGTAGHGDCDVCADLAMCSGQVKAQDAMVQVVPIKNGVMYVYTADSPSKVQAVQAQMQQRTQRISAMLASADKAKLCPECKDVRGAMASGKLSRELVNIEGGCLQLMTSSDPSMVNKLYAMAGVKSASRKS